jgi:Tfp pilus assembly protein PilN
MINLLPLKERRELRAARTNTLLLRYNICFLIVVIFLGAAEGITYLYMGNSKAAAEQTIAQNRAKVSNFATVAAEALQFQGNLATAKQILDREVTYSKTILAIAKLLPRGVVLENLTLDASTFGTETTLIATAKNYSRALALKGSFEKSPLFSNVHFKSIAASAEGTRYPVTVNLNVTIKKDAAK